jgi:hypothetical protein
MDYIEKIIQIPYRVRPIEPRAAEDYLGEQMHLAEEARLASDGGEGQSTRGGGVGGTAQAGQTLSPLTVSDRPPSGKEIEFSPHEYDAWVRCCRALDMTPRAIKRLVNVSKVIKMIWQRRGLYPDPEVVRTTFALLALAERYPNLMRGLIETIVAAARAGPPPAGTIREIIAGYETPQLSPYLCREWEGLQRIAEKELSLPLDIKPNEMRLETLNLVRSFCFVGDPGFDPSDAQADAIDPGTLEPAADDEPA